MIHIVLIEDEKHAASSLVSQLEKLQEDIRVVAVLKSVQESIRFFRHNNGCDLILSDVQLSDGLSFAIFDAVPLNTPVIFITAYNQFIVDAFDHNGINYLLKPVSSEALKKALAKYKMLRSHFEKTENTSALLHYIRSKKTRIIVKKGVQSLSLLLSDVALFYTSRKVTYAVDKAGVKYLIDKNLAQLEDELDNQFFRANRQYIINVNYIKSFSAYERVKIEVEMNLPFFEHPIIISQETAPLFKKWISEA